MRKPRFNSNFILVLVFFIGLSLLLYPSVSDWWNSKHQTQAIVHYSEAIAAIFERMDEMSTIVDIVMNDPYAIGYSIMTYLDDVYDNEELKVFAVNGVVPSVDTVKDGSYPYHTQGYVVIRSDEPAGSPARRLYDWFGSPVSDEILIACGITPLHDENGIG